MIKLCIIWNVENMNHHQKHTATSWKNKSARNDATIIGIRATDEKDDASERLSAFANQINQFTLDVEAEIHIPAKSDTLIYNDFKRNCPD